MTPTLCQNMCGSKGFSMAGLEYGAECYCGNSFANNLGGPIPDSQCSMACAGDSAFMCGGSWALSVFKQSSGPARRSRHWLNVRD
ncbi:hypothetical protein NM688_g3800 [Phlebia brevispora]|uniref:Uncharacterized protein n=1 Tax=Phlebia brevispora TaxID=194682 RepID=A0ACC1T4W0_9APHY|nr:hypothetical protein NM688_g3800 [Phlebia brevispora]